MRALRLRTADLFPPVPEFSLACRYSRILQVQTLNLSQRDRMAVPMLPCGSANRRCKHAMSLPAMLQKQNMSLSLCQSSRATSCMPILQQLLNMLCTPLLAVTQVLCVTFCSLLGFFFSTLPVTVPAGEHCIAASESVPKVTCFLGPSDPPASSPGVFRADPDPEPGVPDLPRLLLLLLGDKTLVPTRSRLVTFCNLQRLDKSVEASRR